MKTAVEWYAIESGKLELGRAKGFLTFPQMFNKMLDILNEAKKMEKQQIIDSFKEGTKMIDVNDELSAIFNGIVYYDETFKIK